MDLQLAEAMWRLNVLSPSQLQPVALQALAEGHHGPALMDLAQHPYATRGEVADLVERALAETGATPLPQDEAARRAVVEIARQIVAAEVSPSEGVDRIGQLHDLSGAPTYVLQFYLLAEEYLVYQGYRNAEPERIDRDIVALARKLLTQQDKRAE